VPTTDLAVRVYSRSARALGALFVAGSAASVPVIAGLVLLATDPPIVPPVLLRLFTVGTLLPAALAGLVRWTCRARARVEDRMLVLERRGLRVEVPCAAIARLRPWRLPVPEPAVTVRLASGRRLAWSIGLEDPVRLLAQLAASGEVAPAAAAVEMPPVAYARARAAGWRRSWRRLLGKFPGFALLPGTAFFITHQWIAYGGPLGQYRLEGLGPYLSTFATYWTTMTIYLALFAGLWRGAAEAVCLGLAWVLPARVELVRSIAEWGCRVAYFGGVPVLVTMRYLA
jgi:hypothetical protein